jgi:pilus assembly protein CpaF
MEGDTVLTQDLFEFQQTGIGPTGQVLGRFRSTGTRSSFVERIQTAGLKVPAAMFDADIVD